jgi:hypothetical protein
MAANVPGGAIGPITGPPLLRRRHHSFVVPWPTIERFDAYYPLRQQV